MADLAAAAVLVVFGLVVAFVVVPAQTSVGFAGTGGLSSAFMPTLAALGVSGLAVALLVATLRSPPPQPARHDGAAPGGRLRIAAIAALVCASAFAMSRFGVVAALPLLAAGAGVVLGERRPLPLLLLAVGTPLFFHVAVERLLGIPLP